jgi:hypothetical protein
MKVVRLSVLLVVMVVSYAVMQLLLVNCWVYVLVGMMVCLTVVSPLLERLDLECVFFEETKNVLGT